MSIESDQVTKINKDTSGYAEWLKPNDLGGRVRIAKFFFNTTSSLKSGEVIANPTAIDMAIIPSNAQLLGIRGNFEAMGAGVVLNMGLRGRASSGYDKAGTADDDDFLIQNVDVSAVGVLADAFDVPGFLYQTDKEVYVTAKLSGAVAAADKDISGVIFYTDNT